MPSVSIPVTSSSALANAPTATYPAENALVDKLVSTPNSQSSATSPPAAAKLETRTSASVPPSATNTTPATVAAAGPYDPNAYQPSVSPTSSSVAVNESSEGADRYAVSSRVPANSSAVATAPVMSNPQPLASDPADRYGSPRNSTAPSAMPGQTPLTDPNQIAADRYANPNLPSLDNKAAKSATPPATAIAETPHANAALPASPGVAPVASRAESVPAVQLASAPGQYRPGGTSTYVSALATTPLEIASRPASATASSVMPATTGAAGGQTLPPAASTAPVPVTRY